MEFYQTMAGKRFLEGQLPRLIKGVERIADAMEDANQKETLAKEAQPDTESAIRICYVTIVSAMEELLDRHDGTINPPEGLKQRIVGDDYVFLTDQIKATLNKLLSDAGGKEKE